MAKVWNNKAQTKEKKECGLGSEDPFVDNQPWCAILTTSTLDFNA